MQRGFGAWCRCVEAEMIFFRPSLTVENIRSKRNIEWIEVYNMGIIPYLAALKFVLDTYENDIDEYLIEVQKYGHLNRHPISSSS